MNPAGRPERECPGRRSRPELQAVLEKGSLPPESKTALEQAVRFVRPRYETLRRESEADQWLLKLSLAAYDKSPARNPKWDEVARRAIRLALVGSPPQSS